jgi:hypothetical protein
MSFTLAVLFALALKPVWAEGVDEKIKVLESELATLKTQQVEIKRETARATAAADAMPAISWRPGRGLTLQAADKSWRANVNYEAQGQLSFFPDTDARAPETGETGGPAQGNWVTRHMETEWNFGMYDDLFEVGMDMDWSGSTPRTKSRRFRTNLNKFSPYYPIVDWMHISVRSYNPVYNSSSGTGTTLERANVMDSFFSTMSQRGLGLTWQNVPLGMGRIQDLTLALTTGQQYNSVNSSSNVSKKGFVGAMEYQPFSSMKGSPFQGLGIGAGYLNDHMDRSRGSSSPAVAAVSAGSKGGGDPTIFSVDTNGRRQVVSVWTQYNQGPYRLAVASDWHTLDRDFSQPAFVTGTKLKDAKINDLLFRAGYFVWGDENGGLMVAYNHFRNYFDAGKGYATRNNLSSSMRRSHEIKNIITTRYFYKPNIIYSLEARANHYDKMESAADARKLGISVADAGSGGGTATEIVFAVKYDF